MSAEKFRLAREAGKRVGNIEEPRERWSKNCVREESERGKEWMMQKVEFGGDEKMNWACNPYSI